jgi:hypothetical protein
MSAPSIRKRLEALQRLRSLRVEQALRVVDLRRHALARAEQALASERVRLTNLRNERSAQQEQMRVSAPSTASVLSNRAERIHLMDERMQAQAQVIAKAQQLRDAADKDVQLARVALRQAQNREEAIKEQLRRCRLEESASRMRAHEEATEELLTSRAAGALRQPGV